jgi:hypothetical protein
MMKTKELIRQLQEEDPTGEEEVCVHNEPIFFLENLPAYYDGLLQVLIRDEKNKFYNVIGAELRGEGRKVKIHLHSIEDAIFENPDLPVTIVGTNYGYKSRVEKWREEARKIREKTGYGKNRRTRV